MIAAFFLGFVAPVPLLAPVIGFSIIKRGFRAGLDFSE